MSQYGTYGAAPANIRFCCSAQLIQLEIDITYLLVVTAVTVFPLLHLVLYGAATYI